MTDERCLARGSVDRIGAQESCCEVEIGSWSEQRTMPVADHGVAVAACLEQLTNPEHGVLQDASEVSAIGFKAVHGGRLSGVFAVDDDLLDAMTEMNAAAPAHNPPYIAAMKALRTRFPELPLVAAFETDFHRTIPAARREYAIPRQWADEFHIRKYGFHGASHRYIATRSASLLGRDDARVISSFGRKQQPDRDQEWRKRHDHDGNDAPNRTSQNNRVGDFDPFFTDHGTHRNVTG